MFIMNSQTINSLVYHDSGLHGSRLQIVDYLNRSVDRCGGVTKVECS